MESGPNLTELLGALLSREAYLDLSGYSIRQQLGWLWYEVHNAQLAARGTR